MPNFLTSAMSAFRFPRWLSGKESICQCRRCRRHEFNSWVGKILWRRKCQPTPVFLPGKSHGEKSLVSYSPWSHKESDTAKYAHGSVPGEEIKWICSIKKSQNIISFHNILVEINDLKTQQFKKILKNWKTYLLILY